MIHEEQRPRHHRDSLIVAGIVLGVIAIAALVAPFYVSELNRIIVLTFPLGFYLAAQGALLACVIGAFWFANQQERVDRKHGAVEDI